MSEQTPRDPTGGEPAAAPDSDPQMLDQRTGGEATARPRAGDV